MPAVPVEMCLGGTDVTDARARPGGEWTSAVVAAPGEDGTNVSLRMWRVIDGLEVEILSDPVPATGRGLSGGVHVWHPDGDVVFVVTRTAGIVRVDIEDDRPVRTIRLPFGPDRSWSTPAVSTDGRTLAAVADWREVCSWELDHDPSVGAVATVHSGPDFVIDCEWWGDGVMAVAWDRPAMPWTSSHVIGADLPHGASVQQPRASANGRTCAWVDDRDGDGCRVTGLVDDQEWWIDDDDAEHAGPTWGPGQRSFCLNHDGSWLAYTRNIDGFVSLWLTRIMPGRIRTGHRIGLGVHSCLSWEGDTLAAVRSGAVTPPQVVAYDVSGELFPIPDGGHDRGVARTIVLDTADPRWRNDHATDLVEPVSHTISDHPFSLNARVYTPLGAHGGLIVWVHGGPYDQWQVGWRPRLSYWLSRGWTICVPDHRGSSGHGRNFMAAQEGDWGGADAEDTLRFARLSWNSGNHAPGHTVFMGASAGGLTALNAARIARLESTRVGGVVVSCPVVDLDAMFDGDDPFESHDMPRLIGERGSASVARRSPHLNARELVDVPILVFHGDLDTSVPLFHSQQLVDAVNAVGGSAELVVMSGEGHGFRDPDNVRREYALTGRFLDRVTGDHGDHVGTGR